jgi:hypothetical protein
VPPTGNAGAVDALYHDTAAVPRRTFVEVVVDLSESRHAWPGDLQMDTAYQVPLQQLEREVAAALEATHARLRRA